MNVVSRGIRNAFRNQIRTFSIVIILGLSMGLALSMLVARQAVADKITAVKSSIGNTISVTPAGARGFEGGGEPLTTAQVAKLKQVSHVSAVTSTLSDRLTSSNTNLKSAVDAGFLGNRAGNNSGVGFMAPPEQSGASNNSSNTRRNVTRTFTPPVTVTGVSDTSSASIYGGDTVSFTSGQAFDASKDENVAVIGKSLAEKNNLSVGSTFTAYGKTIKVVGIYDTGNTFANNGIVMPLAAVQRLSSQTNDVTSATVTVDSIDNINTAVSSIKSTLGSSADVVSNQETAQNAVAPLENVKTISTYSLIGALVAGATIILLTMVMIVRERRREIGVLKAIGASNVRTMLQFVSEAVTLTMLGLVVGMVIGVAASSPVTNALVTNSSSSNNTQRMEGGPGRGGRVGIRGFGNSVRNVQANVGADIILYGVGAAVVIAVVGSALPALLISKVRPAEVMRVE